MSKGLFGKKNKKCPADYIYGIDSPPFAPYNSTQQSSYRQAGAGLPPRAADYTQTSLIDRAFRETDGWLRPMLDNLDPAVTTGRGRWHDYLGMWIYGNWGTVTAKTGDDGAVTAITMTQQPSGLSPSGWGVTFTAQLDLAGWLLCHPSAEESTSVEVLANATGIVVGADPYAVTVTIASNARIGTGLEWDVATPFIASMAPSDTLGHAWMLQSYCLMAKGNAAYIHANYDTDWHKMCAQANRVLNVLSGYNATATAGRWNVDNAEIDIYSIGTNADSWSTHFFPYTAVAGTRGNGHQATDGVVVTALAQAVQSYRDEGNPIGFALAAIQAAEARIAAYYVTNQEYCNMPSGGGANPNDQSAAFALEGVTLAAKLNISGTKDRAKRYLKIALHTPLLAQYFEADGSYNYLATGSTTTADVYGYLASTGGNIAVGDDHLHLQTAFSEARAPILAAGDTILVMDMVGNNHETMTVASLADSNKQINFVETFQYAHTAGNLSTTWNTLIMRHRNAWRNSNVNAPWSHYAYGHLEIAGLALNAVEMLRLSGDTISTDDLLALKNLVHHAVGNWQGVRVFDNEGRDCTYRSAQALHVPLNTLALLKYPQFWSSPTDPGVARDALERYLKGLDYLDTLLFEILATLAWTWHPADGLPPNSWTRGMKLSGAAGKEGGFHCWAAHMNMVARIIADSDYWATLPTPGYVLSRVDKTHKRVVVSGSELSAGFQFMKRYNSTTLASNIPGYVGPAAQQVSNKYGMPLTAWGTGSVTEYTVSNTNSSWGTWVRFAGDTGNPVHNVSRTAGPVVPASWKVTDATGEITQADTASLATTPRVLNSHVVTVETTTPLTTVGGTAKPYDLVEKWIFNQSVLRRQLSFTLTGADVNDECIVQAGVPLHGPVLVNSVLDNTPTALTMPDTNNTSQADAQQPDYYSVYCMTSSTPTYKDGFIIIPGVSYDINNTTYTKRPVAADLSSVYNSVNYRDQDDLCRHRLVFLIANATATRIKTYNSKSVLPSLVHELFLVPIYGASAAELAVAAETAFQLVNNSFGTYKNYASVPTPFTTYSAIFSWDYLGNEFKVVKDNSIMGIDGWLGWFVTVNPDSSGRCIGKILTADSMVLVPSVDCVVTVTRKVDPSGSLPVSLTILDKDSEEVDDSPAAFGAYTNGTATSATITLTAADGPYTITCNY